MRRAPQTARYFKLFLLRRLERRKAGGKEKEGRRGKVLG